MRKKSTINWFVPSSNAITSTTIHVRHSAVATGKKSQQDKLLLSGCFVFGKVDTQTSQCSESCEQDAVGIVNVKIQLEAVVFKLCKADELFVEVLLRLSLTLRGGPAEELFENLELGNLELPIS